MPTICRLLELPPDLATALIAEPGTLTQAVESAKIYTDVYATGTRSSTSSPGIAPTRRPPGG
jgi:hypothetical protein